MSRIGEQKSRINDIEAARYITGALRDISAVELKKLRKKFEQNDVVLFRTRGTFSTGLAYCFCR